MNISKTHSDSLIEEFKNSKVEVIFSDKGYHGSPYYEFLDDTVKIIEDKPREFKTSDGKKIGTEAYTYIPFEVILNATFHTVQDTMFFTNKKYFDHVKNITEEVINEIDTNINLRLGKWDILDYFKVLELNLNEIKTGFKEIPISCEGSDGKGIHNKIARYVSTNCKQIFMPPSGDWVIFVLTAYWKVQINAIERILKYLSIRKEIIESTDDYVKAISELPTGIGNLIWNKSDTDLLELVTALIESGSVQNHTKDLTRKKAIEIFSQIFNIEIKDAESKLSRATNRKKDVSQYLTQLKETFEDYSKRKLDNLDLIR